MNNQTLTQEIVAISDRIQDPQAVVLAERTWWGRKFGGLPDLKEQRASVGAIMEKAIEELRIRHVDTIAKRWHSVDDDIMQLLDDYGVPRAELARLNTHILFHEEHQKWKTLKGQLAHPAFVTHDEETRFTIRRRTEILEQSLIDKSKVSTLNIAIVEHWAKDKDVAEELIGHYRALFDMRQNLYQMWKEASDAVNAIQSMWSNMESRMDVAIRSEKWAAKIDALHEVAVVSSAQDLMKVRTAANSFQELISGMAEYLRVIAMKESV